MIPTLESLTADRSGAAADQPRNLKRRNDEFAQLMAQIDRQVENVEKPVFSRVDKERFSPLYPNPEKEHKPPAIMYFIFIGIFAFGYSF